MIIFINILCTKKMSETTFLGGWIYALDEKMFWKFLEVFFWWNFEIYIYLEKNPKLLKPQIWKENLDVKVWWIFQEE